MATWRRPVRFSTLEKFKASELRLLVCSDVAARGLDIGGLSHVFNFDVPIHAEDYVHRIGRTGRAGLEGKAFTIAVAGGPLRGGADREADRSPDPADAGRRPGSGRLVRAGRPKATRAEDGGAEEGRGQRHRRRTGRGAKPERNRQRSRTVRKASRASRGPGANGRRTNARSERRRCVRPGGARRARRGAVAARATAERESRGTSPRDDPRRERYRREDDLGPAVVGFGDDVPAFMLLRPRSDADHQMTENR